MKRKEKGITLIALIITIIVMLILVGVTVNVAIQGGLFSTARKANLETRAAIVEEKAVEWKANKEADEYVENKTAQELEELLNDLEDQNLITPEERVTIEQTGQVTIGSRTIIFEEDDDLAKLKKYFLEEVEMEEFYNGLNNNEFPNTETIPDANSSLKPMSLFGEDGSVDGTDSMKIGLYMQYNKKVFKVLLTGSAYDGDLPSIKDVELVYQPHGREGQKVKYDGDKDGTEEEWTILYDNGDTIEIVSPKSMGSLTLGSKDEKAKDINEDINKDDKVDDIDKAIYSYNNAIKTLNEYCEGLITNENKISVRSIGSNPQDSKNENNTLFTSDLLTQWGKGSYNNLAKSTNENYEQDLVRMLYWGLTEENPFWMASRAVYFHVSSVGPLSLSWYLRVFSPELYDEALFTIYKSKDSVDCSDLTHAVRPVVKVSSDGITIE